MGNSKIEWTERTWNPITGCSPISEGCKNCYAKRMAKRLAANPNVKHRERYKNFKVSFWPERLEEPLKIKKPSMFFVCSMGDLLHDDVKEEWIDEILDVIAACPQHVFQILTKRPENIEQKLYGYFGEDPSNQSQVCGPIRFLSGGDSLLNVWLGVTAENQLQADRRIPELLKIPAVKRFVSVEPMLGHIDITNKGIKNGYSMPTAFVSNGYGIEWTDPGEKYIGLDWVICGGETGPGARPMHPAWARNLRDQCKIADVPFFFKQWGEYWPAEQGQWLSEAEQYCDTDLDVEYYKIGKKRAGRLLDGVLHDGYPIARKGGED